MPTSSRWTSSQSRFTTPTAPVQTANTTVQNTTLSTSTVTPTSTTTSAAATSTADLEAICEAQAGGYANRCPQCLYTCETSSAPDQCYFSVFTAVNYVDSVCQAHGGSGCANTAVNEVCSGS